MSKRSRTTRRLILLCVISIPAIYMLQLAYPRVRSSLGYIPVEAALKRHWGDYPIRQRQYPPLINIAETAIGRLDLARYWLGLGWLHYLRATDPDTPEADREQALQGAQQAFERVLKKSPASPAVWLRLAWVHELLKHDSPPIINALNMSIYTGRAQRFLVFNRLDLALRYADDFAAEDLNLIRDQIQLAWQFNPGDTLTYMREGKLNSKTLLSLITNTNPELAAEILDKL